MRELWRTIGFTSGARIYGVAAGAISLLITARILGPEGRGFIAVATTWALVYATLGNLSLGQVALKRGAAKDPSQWLGPSLGSLLAMTGLVSALGWSFAGALYAATGGEVYGDIPGYALALGFLQIPLLVWEQYGSLLLPAVGKLSIYNRAQVTGRTVGVLLVVVLVWLLDTGVAGALVALFVSQLIVSAAGARYLIRRAGRTLSFDRAVLRSLVVDGLKLHPNALGTFLFASAAVLIVQTVEGPAATGQFQLAVQITGMALLVPRGASMVLYGEVAQKGPDAAWPANRKVLVVLSALVAVAAAVGALLAPLVVPLVFGEDFEDSVGAFQVLALALVGQTFSLCMAPQWIGRGLFWQASAITLALGVANVIACFALVASEGMIGAAYALAGVWILSVIANGGLAVLIERRAGTGRSPGTPTSPPPEAIPPTEAGAPPAPGADPR